MKRRNFIRISSLSTTGWVLVQMLPLKGFAENAEPACFQPSPLIKMCDDGKIIIYVQKQESGQGVQTSLPLIIAEELEADPKDIVVQPLPFDNNPKEGGKYETGGSTSVPFGYDALRKAGATAREMLIAAAAATWKVPTENLKAERSKVVNTVSGQELSFKELYATAAKMEVPKNPPLKNYKDFRLIGKPGQKKTNLKDVLTGHMKFSLDVKVEGMLYGAVLHCPVYGGKPVSWDESSIKSIEGIVKIVEVKQMGDAVSNHGGVGIIATNRWSALKAQQKLVVKWNLGPNATAASDTYNKQLVQASQQKGDLIRDVNDKPGTLQSTTSAGWVKASYAIPFLAHAAMEPVNCIAQYKNGKFELWGGTQNPGKVTNDCAAFFGIQPQDIFINLAMMGGAFGRRLNVDYMGEAMQLAKAVDKPVQLMYTRFDDIKYGTFRPASAHLLSAKLKADGLPEVLQHQMGMTPVSDFFDGNKSLENLTYGLNGGFEGDMYYAIPTVNGSVKRTPSALPTGWWRAVNFTHNAWVIEAFMDELAAKAKMDPLQYRLKLLAPLQPMTMKGFIHYNPRRLENVLKKAAEMIEWDKKREPGTGVGIACCFYNHAKAYTAHAFEVSVNKAKEVKMHRAAVATDIGIVIDPDGLRNQIEGGFVWGMSAAVKSEITFSAGTVEQSNYFDYEVMRMGELPPLEIHVVESGEEPGGAGETSVPSVFAAFTNAIAAASGLWVRQLPVKSAGFAVSA